MNRFPLLFGLLCAAGALSLSQPARAQDPCNPTPTPGVLHTLAYHQVTAFPQHTAMTQPVMSGNGNKIAFTDAPGTGNEATPNRIYTVNPDGSGLVQDDSYRSRCFCNSFVDLSDDGSKVVSTDAVQVRIADGGGGGAKSLLVLNSNEIDALRISGDGSKVFFKIGRDTGNLGPDGTSPVTPIQRGVWVINADGTGLRQVVSPAQFAAVIGRPADQAPFFQSSVGSVYSRMDVSSDGSKIVFSNWMNYIADWNRYDVFVVNLDGSGLRALLGSNPVWVWNVAFDQAGSKVAVSYSPFGRHSDLNDVEVMNYDGTGKKILRTHTNRDTLQLSSDGSKLLVGGGDPTFGGLLFDTVSGEVVQLAQITPGSGGHTTVLYSGMVNATMNGAANRFAYKMSYINCADCANQPVQLAVAELNPSGLGAAPALSEMKVDPPYAVAGKPNSWEPSATASMKVTTANKIEAVGVNFFRNGLYDINLRGGSHLYDDATNGDTTAGDKLFTTHHVRHGYIIIREGNMDLDLGPRTVRFSSEVRAGDGKLHAAAVDIQPFTVVKTPPVPTVTNIYPKQLQSGATLTENLVEGTNFTGTPALAYLLNGQPDPAVLITNVKVLDSTRITFDVRITSQAKAGQRVLQVTTPAGSSAADGAPASSLTVREIDINGDDSLNISDAITLLRKIVGLD